jgi:hypothetical protein
MPAVLSTVELMLVALYRGVFGMLVLLLGS